MDVRRERIQSEVIAAFEQYGDRGIAILPTGTGKSRIVVERIKRLAEIYPAGRFVYTCDNTRLRDVDFPAELQKWDASDLVDIIERYCYASAYKIEGQDFDVWIADEFDYMLTPEYVKFALNNRFRHKLLVSATLDGEKRKMAEQIAPIIYERKTFEIENEGIINKSRHLLLNYMLTEPENQQYLKYNEKFSDLMQDDSFRAKERLKFLVLERKLWLANLDSTRAICKELIAYLFTQVPATRALIFSNSVTQIDSIMPWTYHGESAKQDWLARFNEGAINFLGVVGKIDRGVNLSNVNTIIFEGLSASETKMIQRSGRGKRMQQDEILDVYYLIPYFKSDTGKTKPTIVLKWFEQSTKNINRNTLVNFILPCRTIKTSI